eukprot:TRINITY_DN10340_c0_g1_i1.p1 TRINITY_DN10340_c0_g1~~TRINITY_DN10340_c0_g1_i1.p1  ORF type:complete len:177 (-),score=33.00 TRINITY_DN10340_c0_g1_i1:268-798(-)
MGRRGLVVDTLSRATDSDTLESVIRQTPQTDYVLEHFGCGCDVQKLTANLTEFGEWRRGIQGLARLANVRCLQVGGVMAGFGSAGSVQPEAIRPVLEVAVQEFGYQRLCFEGNWFFSNWQGSTDGAVLSNPHPNPSSMDGLGTWVRTLSGLLEELGASQREFELVFRRNAMSIYRV